MSSRGVTESLGKLKISEKVKTKKAEPVDSWEDAADDSSETETEDAGTSTPQRPSTSDVPNAPPPTPSSPKSPRERIAYQSFSPLQFDGAFENTSLDYGFSIPGVGTAGEEKRPEKTTAVASRLIAAGLGQRAPKRTKEQREYDQAMKIQEKKKRDAAKEAEDRKKREAEAAKKAIWDD